MGRGLASRRMPDEAILETRGLRKEFQGFVAVNGIDLSVKRGSIHALIGPNGAGKTTVFNLLTRFLPATSGSILYEGEDVTRLGPRRWRARGWSAPSRSPRSSRG